MPAVLGMSRSIPRAGTVAAHEPARPTIVLVHGAFECSSSWNGVVPGLEREGYNLTGRKSGSTLWRRCAAIAGEADRRRSWT
jgi:hypothetical protein